MPDAHTGALHPILSVSLQILHNHHIRPPHPPLHLDAPAPHAYNPFHQLNSNQGLTSMFTYVYQHPELFSFAIAFASIAITAALAIAWHNTARH